MEKNVALNDQDQKHLQNLIKSFKKEGRLRWISLLIMVLAFNLIYFLVGKEMAPILSNIFFALVFVAFYFITRYLTANFKKDLLSGVKMVNEGILEKKDYRGFKKKMTSYEINREDKKLTVYHSGPGSKGVLMLNYDRDNFNGNISQGDNLYFTIDGNEIKVDVRHFVEFEEGERIRAEQFSVSRQLIKIDSLDHPGKSIQTTTLKFR